MSALSSFDIQKALYAALGGDAALMAMVTGVYDKVPEHSEYPYVTIGDALTRDWSTKTTRGAHVNMALHVWSRQGGRKETSAIINRLYDLLHEGSLSLTGHTLVMLRCEGSSVDLLPDGQTHHGLINFRALTEEN